jgi:hypothetical protein
MKTNIRTEPKHKRSKKTQTCKAIKQHRPYNHKKPDQKLLWRKKTEPDRRHEEIGGSSSGNEIVGRRIESYRPIYIGEHHDLLIYQTAPTGVKLEKKRTKIFLNSLVDVINSLNNLLRQ